MWQVRWIWTAAVGLGSSSGVKMVDGQSSRLICDVGDSIFDGSLLIIGDGIFEVSATPGDDHLHEEDFYNSSGRLHAGRWSRLDHCEVVPLAQSEHRDAGREHGGVAQKTRRRPWARAPASRSRITHAAMDHMASWRRLDDRASWEVLHVLPKQSPEKCLIVSSGATTIIRSCRCQDWSGTSPGVRLQPAPRRTRRVRC